jgi:hypothetical protein
LDKWAQEFDGHEFFDMNNVTGAKAFPQKAFCGLGMGIFFDSTVKITITLSLRRSQLCGAVSSTE